MEILEALRAVTESIKTWVNSKLSTKVDKVNNKGLSTNDYTNVDKTKVDGIVGIHITSNEPANAHDGDVWFDTSDATPSGASNWDVNGVGQDGYIHNRPFWVTTEDRYIEWDDEATYPELIDNSGVYLIDQNIPSGNDLVGGTICWECTSVQNGETVTENFTYPIIKYCTTSNQLLSTMDSLTSPDVAVVFEGAILAQELCGMLIVAVGGLMDYILYIVTEDAVSYTPGTYAVRYDDPDGVQSYRFVNLSYTAHKSHINEHYKTFFKEVGGTKIHIKNVTSTDVSDVDFSGYSYGDIVLIIPPVGTV